MKTADPDQTAPEARSGTILFAIQLHFLNIITINCIIKSKILAKKVSNKVSEILGHLLHKNKQKLL